MNKKQENKIIKCLKFGKLQGCGQTRKTLQSISGISWAFKHELTNFLQKLKRQGKIMYFDTSKVWYWINDVNENEIFNL